MLSIFSEAARPLFVALLCLLPCLYLFYTDIRYNKLRNIITLPLLLSGLIVSGIYGGLEDSLQGMGVGFIITFIPWTLQGIGGGDVKLSAALGAWFGTMGILQIILLGSLAMFAFGLFRLYKQNRLSEIFTPFKNNLVSKILFPGQGGNIARKLGEVGSVDKLPYGAFLIGAAYVVFTIQNILGGFIL